MPLRKVWEAGSKTLVITLDRTTREAYGIKKGDAIEFDIKKIIKKDGEEIIVTQK